MKTIELFCGTKSFSKVAAEQGHETFTIDNDEQHNPDLCIDIMKFDVSMLPKEFRCPDIVWASPPCTTFSVASLRHYWKNGKPKNKKCLDGIALVKKTIEIINELKPKYFFIENPRGMLRKQDFMKRFCRVTITYCQYGMQWQKATDIWTNSDFWTPRPMCSPRSPCHIRSPRGSKFGVQGINARKGSRSAVQRAVIPPELFKEIFSQMEKR